MLVAFLIQYCTVFQGENGMVIIKKACFLPLETTVSTTYFQLYRQKKVKNTIKIKQPKKGAICCCSV